MIKPTSQAAAAYEEPYSDPYNDSWGFSSPNNFEYLSKFPNAHMVKKSYRTGDILNYSLSSIKDDSGAVMKIFKVEAGKNLYAIEQFILNLMLITKTLLGQL
ncbi:DUF5065 family protein [Bacillus cereus]